MFYLLGVVDAQEIRSALGIMPTRFVDMFLKRVDVDQDGTSTLRWMSFCVKFVKALESVEYYYLDIQSLTTCLSDSSVYG